MWSKETFRAASGVPLQKGRMGYSVSLCIRSLGKANQLPPQMYFSTKTSEPRICTHNMFWASYTQPDIHQDHIRTRYQNHFPRPPTSKLVPTPSSLSTSSLHRPQTSTSDAHLHPLPAKQKPPSSRQRYKKPTPASSPHKSLFCRPHYSPKNQIQLQSRRCTAPEQNVPRSSQPRNL